MKIPRLTLALAGLAALTLTSTGHTQELVTNGGFETGNLNGWSSNPGYAVATGSYAHTGTYGLDYYEGGGLASLTQTLSTIPGDTETITFWEQQFGGTPNEIKLQLGGVTLLDLPNLPENGWVEYTATTTATSNSEVLYFGLRQDPGNSALDDISVVQSSSGPAATPEPGAYAFIGSLALAGAARLRRKRARK